MPWLLSLGGSLCRCDIHGTTLTERKRLLSLSDDEDVPSAEIWNDEEEIYLLKQFPKLILKKRFDSTQ